MKKLSKRNNQISNTVMAFTLCACTTESCLMQCRGNSQVQVIALNGIHSNNYANMQ